MDENTLTNRIINRQDVYSCSIRHESTVFKVMNVFLFKPNTLTVESITFCEKLDYLICIMGTPLHLLIANSLAPTTSRIFCVLFSTFFDRYSSHSFKPPSKKIS